MLKPVFFSAVSTLFAVTMMTSANAQSGSEPPRIIAGTNGEAEAIYSNNCVVYYNARGARTNALPACTRNQISRADVGVASYRREQGLSGGTVAPEAPWASQSVPEVSRLRNGNLLVKIGSNCRVYFNAAGRRTIVVPRCSPAQRTAANEAAASYRREQGLDAPAQASIGTPQIIAGTNGEAEVIYAWNNCVVRYNSRGRWTSNTPRCSSAQRRNADQALMAYRREQGL